MILVPFLCVLAAAAALPPQPVLVFPVTPTEQEMCDLMGYPDRKYHAYNIQNFFPAQYSLFNNTRVATCSSDEYARMLTVTFQAPLVPYCVGRGATVLFHNGAGTYCVNTEAPLDGPVDPSGILNRYEINVDAEESQSIVLDDPGETYCAAVYGGYAGFVDGMTTVRDGRDILCCAGGLGGVCVNGTYENPGGQWTDPDGRCYKAGCATDFALCVIRETNHESLSQTETRTVPDYSCWMFGFYCPDKVETYTVPLNAFTGDITLPLYECLNRGQTYSGCLAEFEGGLDTEFDACVLSRVYSLPQCDFQLQARARLAGLTEAKQAEVTATCGAEAAVVCNSPVCVEGPRSACAHNLTLANNPDLHMWYDNATTCLDAGYPWPMAQHTVLCQMVGVDVGNMTSAAVRSALCASDQIQCLLANGTWSGCEYVPLELLAPTSQQKGFHPPPLPLWPYVFLPWSQCLMYHMPQETITTDQSDAPSGMVACGPSLSAPATSNRFFFEPIPHPVCSYMMQFLGGPQVNMTLVQCDYDATLLQCYDPVARTTYNSTCLSAETNLLFQPKKGPYPVETWCAITAPEITGANRLLFSDLVATPMDRWFKCCSPTECSVAKSVALYVAQYGACAEQGVFDGFAVKVYECLGDDEFACATEGQRVVPVKCYKTAGPTTPIPAVWAFTAGFVMAGLTMVGVFVGFWVLVLKDVG